MFGGHSRGGPELRSESLVHGLDHRSNVMGDLLERRDNDIIEDPGRSRVETSPIPQALSRTDWERRAILADPNSPLRHQGQVREGRIERSAYQHNSRKPALGSKKKLRDVMLVMRDLNVPPLPIYEAIDRGAVC